MWDLYESPFFYHHIISIFNKCHKINCHLCCIVSAPTLDMIIYDPEATVLEKIRKNERTRLMAVTALCSVLIYLYEGMMVRQQGCWFQFSAQLSWNEFARLLLIKWDELDTELFFKFKPTNPYWITNKYLNKSVSSLFFDKIEVMLLLCQLK